MHFKMPRRFFALREANNTALFSALFPGVRQGRTVDRWVSLARAKSHENTLRRCKLITPIDPELCEEQGGLTFSLYGITKAEGGKFDEFSNDSQFAINRKPSPTALIQSTRLGLFS
jgi:hypothetical protein